MLFNSIDFTIFLPLVFFIYWFVVNNNIQRQNFFLFVVSYFFYGWWDWRFLLLIFFSTVVDYAIGRKLSEEKKPNQRKLYLYASLLVNLGLLGFFKYFNFFLDNVNSVFTLFGSEIRASSLNIILPVGISFYTFQTLSYTIDVYRKKIEPARDFISFAAFVSFFPQLVAGPIERAFNMFPQFYTRRKFTYALGVYGLRQILWGLFKKIVIADNCAQYVDLIFDSPSTFTGSTLAIGAILFSFQIYADFSGYSDIAIGTARLFGFDLMRNFAFPYFSRNVAEFWRRWHISLTTWFRDYLYIPLGGSRGGTVERIRNTLIIFVVSGFWHGAAWTYVLWGALHAFFFLPLLLSGRNKTNKNIVAKEKSLPSFPDLIKILSTFFLITLAWIFFRAPTLRVAFSYVGGLVSTSIFSIPEMLPKTLLLLLGFFLIVEWLARRQNFALAKLETQLNKTSRWGFYFLLILMIFFFSGEEQEFIYFQF